MRILQNVLNWANVLMSSAWGEYLNIVGWSFLLSAAVLWSCFDICIFHKFFLVCHFCAPSFLSLSCCHSVLFCLSLCLFPLDLLCIWNLISDVNESYVFCRYLEFGETTVYPLRRLMSVARRVAWVWWGSIFATYSFRRLHVVDIQGMYKMTMLSLF